MRIFETIHAPDSLHHQIALPAVTPGALTAMIDLKNDTAKAMVLVDWNGVRVEACAPLLPRAEDRRCDLPATWVGEHAPAPSSVLGKARAMTRRRLWVKRVMDCLLPVGRSHVPMA